MESTHVTVADASKALNLSEQQVRTLCRSGKIPAKQYGKTWLLNNDDLHQYYDVNACGVAEDQPCYSKKNTGYKTLSFFSGAMGLDTGLESEGFNILLASEVDNACRKTIRKNKPEMGLIGDIEKYTPAEIKKFAGLKPKEDIDLIIGGPPCQAFSTAGKRKGFNDHRGNLLLVYLNIISQLKPKYAVIENVRGLLSAPLKHRPLSERGPEFPELTEEELPGGAIKHILKFLNEIGYGVSFNLYNAANFGTPQKRERIVMICSRDGKKAPYLIPTNSETGLYGLPKWKTLKQTIGKIKENEQHYIEFPEKRLTYYRMLKPGQNWRNLPVEIQKKAMGGSFDSGGGKTGFYRRLAWDEPSPTLVTHPAMPATDLAHPEKNRPLSVEEYKLIQEFPPEWQIEGTLLEQYKQIGNAVPNSLGKAIGRQIKLLLTNSNIPEYPDFPYSRYKNTSDRDIIM